MDFILILKAIIFGIIEGITEWLPISSTGHMILLESFLKTEESLGSEFFSLFLVVIQLGAIIAVIVYYFNRINPFFGKSLIDNTKPKDKSEKKRIWLLWGKVLVACLPAAIIGFIFDDLLDKYLFNSLTVSITLIVYGIIFILIEYWNKRRTFNIKTTDELTWKKAILIGCFQLLALIPGTSRSGITIIGAMLLLCDRSVSAEFSFFLSIPIMFGASFLKIIKFIISGSLITSTNIVFLLIGFVVAFIVSIFAIKFLTSFIKKHDFKVFGIYRIVVGIVMLVLFITNVIE